MANKKKREQEIAFQLFVNTNLSQKEIAARVGVTEKTLSGWVNDEEENWEKIKEAKNSGNDQTIAALRELLGLQAKKNKEKIEKGEFTKNDADSLLEISKSIKILEGDEEIPLKLFIKVMEQFMDFIPYEDKIRIPLAEYQMEFLLSKAGPKNP